MTELKPCPFCGGEAVYQKFNVTIPGRIVCGCGAEMRQAKGQPWNELFDAWNTRAERTCKPKKLANGWETCSEFNGELDGTENYCQNCGAKVVEE